MKHNLLSLSIVIVSFLTGKYLALSSDVLHRQLHYGIGLLISLLHLKDTKLQENMSRQ